VLLLLLLPGLLLTGPAVTDNNKQSMECSLAVPSMKAASSLWDSLIVSSTQDVVRYMKQKQNLTAENNSNRMLYTPNCNHYCQNICGLRWP
jgi:hypothetical protein